MHEMTQIQVGTHTGKIDEKPPEILPVQRPASTRCLVQLPVTRSGRWGHSIPQSAAKPRRRAFEHAPKVHGTYGCETIRMSEFRPSITPSFSPPDSMDGIRPSDFNQERLVNVARQKKFFDRRFRTYR